MLIRFNTTVLFQDARNVISLDFLRRRQSITKTMFIGLASLARQEISFQTSVLVDRGMQIRDAFTSICDLFFEIYVWSVHLLHNIWTALVDAFNSMTQGVLNALAIVVRTLKMGCWIALLLVALVAFLSIAAHLRPHLVRVYKSLRAAEHRRREEARLRRFMKERRRLAEQEAQRQQREAQRQEEARKKKADEEAKMRSQAQQRELREQQRVKRRYDDWQAAAAKMLADKASMRRFPEPQMDACRTCQTQSQQAERVSDSDLRICVHNLRKLLKSSGRYKELLREARATWHPDRFGTTPTSVRCEMTRKATSLFQMIESLHREDDDCQRR